MPSYSTVVAVGGFANMLFTGLEKAENLRHLLEDHSERSVTHEIDFCSFDTTLYVRRSFSMLDSLPNFVINHWGTIQSDALHMKVRLVVVVVVYL